MPEPHDLGDAAAIRAIDAAAYDVPTDAPESDGTAEWDKTTLVTVDISAGRWQGFGYTYCDRASALFVREHLAKALVGKDAFATAARWRDMEIASRNAGRRGVAACAISAIDVALWDLKAKALGVPLTLLLGGVRDAIAVYGSGGFTSYDAKRLREQLGGWARDGMRMVKMKVGRDAGADPERVRVARDAIGKDVSLFVDANGAYARKQALFLAERFAEEGVRWFEEPVSSDDLEGLRLLRDRAPSSIDVAAGEYGYDVGYFRAMLEAGAVDVLQADATRCGITGFLGASALCEAFQVPLSSHCAPSLHVHLGCALRPMRHLEYFHDHVRIESMLFDGAPRLVNGALVYDRSRAGLGLAFKKADAERFAKRL